MLPVVASLLVAAVQAQAPAVDRPGAIEGVAVVEGTDNPVPDVVIRFDSPRSPGEAVTTDEMGRFRLAAADLLPEWKVRDGEQGPGCSIRRLDRRWRSEVVTFESGKSRREDAGARDAGLGAEPARARWRVREGRVSLEVPCPPSSELEVVVRGPDGAPLADRELRVYPVGAPAVDDASAALRIHVRTDREGRFRTRWFVGLRPLRIEAPGVGFGLTGSVEVRADRTDRAEPPPLARCGRIEGTVEPGLMGPGTSAVVGEGAWDQRRCEVDARGRFAIDDVIPGRRTVRLFRSGTPIPTAPAVVTATPGQTTRVALRGPAAGRGPGEGPGRDPDETFQHQGVLVEGTVQDEAGKPLEGARVFARAHSYGGTSLMGEPIQSGTTDVAGRFRIEGPIHSLMGPVSVWALAGSRPASMAYSVAPRPRGERRQPLTITVADRGAGLRFDVVRGGHPVRNVDVELEPSPSGPDGWSPVSEFGEAAEREMGRLRRALAPSVRTGADGVARFRDMPPGRYRARLRGELDASGRRWHAAATSDVVVLTATADGIAAVARRETRYRIAVHPQAFQFRVRVRRPDGSMPKDRLIVFGNERRVPTMLTPWATGDDPALIPVPTHELGLWVVRARFRDTTSEVNRVDGIQAEPFCEATAVVPFSPALTLPDPLDLNTWRREPGSVRARLLDARGEPARGTVLLTDLYGRGDPTRHAGTTDRNGEVLFRDVPSGEFTVFGFVDGQPAPPGVMESGAFPALEELRGRHFVPDVPVKVRSGAEASVTLALRPAAYVRGALRVPPGSKPGRYGVAAWRPEPLTAIGCRYEADSGRFLCGPLTPEAVQITATEEPVATDGVGRTAPRRVELSAGAVVEVELTPPAPAPAPGVALPGMGTGSLREAIAAMPAGTVERSGGGPAAGARALLFVPGEDGPTAAGIADASGRLTWGGVTTRERLAAPNPDRPTAVVWLPGAAGAAIAEVRVGQALRVTLPKPVSVTGRVTLGGGPLEGHNARVRVVAASRGRGVFDGVLSAGAPVEADGRFTLHGLSAGRYAVQATRDDIWLSRATDLTVSPDAPPHEPVLDIAEPGESIAVTVVDEQGRPAVDVPVTPVRPEGPLAGLWPDAFRTDASGTVVIRGLEAGTHRLRIDGQPARQEVRVGKAVQPAGPPVPVRVTRGGESR